MKNIVKGLLIVIALVLFCQMAWADVYVNGYFRSNGTYVQPHYRSNPDGIAYNNYSYPGNYNPNTGRISTGNHRVYSRHYSEWGY